MANHVKIQRHIRHFRILNSCTFITLNLVCVYFLVKYFLHRRELILFGGNSNIEAHVPWNDMILPLDEMTSFLSARDESRDAYFFVETTGSGFVKSRFVCGVESAARLHPEADIYLLMTYVPEYLDLSNEDNDALKAILYQYSNVKVLRVDLEKLTKGTAWKSCYQKNILEKSKFRAVHTCDVVKFLTAYKYGGKILDLDLMLAERLSNITKFVIPLSSTGPHMAMAFQFDRGSKLLERCIKEQCDKFQTENWQFNGVGILNSLLPEYCGVQLENISPDTCDGVTVLPHVSFYPLEYFELKLYFDEAASEETMVKLESMPDVLGYHVGNGLVSSEVVEVGSEQPYGLLAQNHCPYAYWNSGKTF